MSDAAAKRHDRSITHSRPDACSVLWDNAQTTALGTAPVATFWVALEQNGPWGARAATQSRLDPDLGRTVDAFCQEGSGRFILIRRPGRHPDSRDGNQWGVGPQKVYIAGGLADRPWLLEADLDDPGRLARLAPLARGQTAGSGGSPRSPGNPDSPGGLASPSSPASLGFDAVREALPELRPSPGPVLMICANSRRDVCCSVRGRPVAVESGSQRPGQVWECSHTGGHRFAPTGVLLPYGQTYGRLTGSSAVAALDAAMRAETPDQLLGPTYDRGRSHLVSPGQAAESLVRERTQEHSLLALSTTVASQPDEENTWQCRVTHIDGRQWDVLAVRGTRGVDLPDSCGKQPVPSWQWSIVG